MKPELSFVKSLKTPVDLIISRGCKSAPETTDDTEKHRCFCLLWIAGALLLLKKESTSARRTRSEQ